MKPPFNLFIVLTALVLLPFSTFASYNMYLSATGITGDSTAPGYEKQVNVASFSLGAVLPVTTGGTGGAVGGKVTFSALTIQKSLDQASPDLLYDCAVGANLSQVVLTLVQQSSTPAAFYTITLKNAMVSSVQSSGAAGGGDRPSESVSFSFQAITWTYQSLDTNGNLGAKITHTYNVTDNTGT